MMKKAISVTLRPDNLLWLRAQTQASARRSVSETLDGLIAAARSAGRGRPGLIKSVVGTIRIAETDPGLARADASIRRLFRGRASRARGPGRSARGRRPRRG
jgi:hypothetical protein